MPWIKLDDRWMDHPKIISAGRDARDMWLASLTYCAKHLTGGYLDDAVVLMLARILEVNDVQGTADRLVDVGLWKRVLDGYAINDYCLYVGHDPTTQELRKTHDYEAWRRAVLARDNCTCQTCGARFRVLHAHHIIPWAVDTARRYDIDNGITLCANCHAALHREACNALG